MADFAELKVLMRGPPRRRLAIAESLTSGRLQARVGAISGASDFFLGGITAYTLEQKVRHLGVDRAAAEAVNGVSAGVAEQMARGAGLLFGAEVSVATTGYAEAAPARGVAQPFAWWGLAAQGSDGSWSLRSGRIDCPGAARVEAQERVADAAMAALLRWLETSGPAGSWGSIETDPREAQD